MSAKPKPIQTTDINADAFQYEDLLSLFLKDNTITWLKRRTNFYHDRLLLTNHGKNGFELCINLNLFELHVVKLEEPDSLINNIMTIVRYLDKSIHVNYPRYCLANEVAFKLFIYPKNKITGLPADTYAEQLSTETRSLLDVPIQVGTPVYRVDFQYDSDFKLKKIATNIAAQVATTGATPSAPSGSQFTFGTIPQQAVSVPTDFTFGTTPQAPPAAPSAPSKFTFGTPPAAPSKFTFGTPPAPSAPSKFTFGTPPAPSAPSKFTFGTAPQEPPSTSMFPMPPSTSASMFPMPPATSASMFPTPTPSGFQFPPVPAPFRW